MSWAVLTDEGFAVLAAAAPGHVEAVRQSLFDRLTPEQVRQLAEICGAVLGRTRTSEHDARVPSCRASAFPGSMGAECGTLRGDFERGSRLVPVRLRRRGTMDDLRAGSGGTERASRETVGPASYR